MFMWVPFLRSFTGNEAHKLFSGTRWGVLGGGPKVYAEKVYVFLSPLRQATQRITEINFARGVLPAMCCFVQDSFCLSDQATTQDELSCNNSPHT